MPNCFSASGKNFGNPYFADVEFNLLKDCKLAKADFETIDLANILPVSCCQYGYIPVLGAAVCWATPTPELSNGKLHTFSYSHSNEGSNQPNLREEKIKKRQYRSLGSWCTGMCCVDRRVEFSCFFSFWCFFFLLPFFRSL